MRELLERARLAWGVLRNRDDALVVHVRREIERVDKDVAENCTNIARVFALEGHSGTSAQIVIPWIQQALSWLPIAPLTGEDSEWADVSAFSPDRSPWWQNKRCFRVFKEADGSCWDTGGRIFRDADGLCYTNHESRVPVTFPYTPRTEYIDR